MRCAEGFSCSNRWAQIVHLQQEWDANMTILSVTRKNTFKHRIHNIEIKNHENTKLYLYLLGEKEKHMFLLPSCTNPAGKWKCNPPKELWRFLGCIQCAICAIHHSSTSMGLIKTWHFIHPKSHVTVDRGLILVTLFRFGRLREAGIPVNRTVNKHPAYACERNR